MFKLFDDPLLDRHIRKLSLQKSSEPAPRRQSPPKELPLMHIKGTIRMFSQKGYGFITRDDGHSDVFVHISAITRAGLRALEKGDRVEFSLAPGRNGKTEAKDIVLLDEAA
jgi:CspA family cold shock protein